MNATTKAIKNILDLGQETEIVINEWKYVYQVTGFNGKTGKGFSTLVSKKRVGALETTRSFIGSKIELLSGIAVTSHMMKSISDVGNKLVNEAMGIVERDDKVSLKKVAKTIVSNLEVKRGKSVKLVTKDITITLGKYTGKARQVVDCELASDELVSKALGIKYTKNVRKHLIKLINIELAA